MSGPVTCGPGVRVENGVRREVVDDPAGLEADRPVTLDEVEGEGHRVIGSHLAVRVSAPGVEGFDELVARADAGCPFSALTHAGGTVSVDARLD